MTLSDFEKSNLEENLSNEQALTKRMKKKKKGCCVNCWKMSTHRKIVPQRKLYDYLADRSSII